MLLIVSINFLEIYICEFGHYMVHVPRNTIQIDLMFANVALQLNT